VNRSGSNPEIIGSPVGGPASVFVLIPFWKPPIRVRVRVRVRLFLD